MWYTAFCNIEGCLWQGSSQSRDSVEQWAEEHKHADDTEVIEEKDDDK